MKKNREWPFCLFNDTLHSNGVALGRWRMHEVKIAMGKTQGKVPWLLQLFRKESGAA